MTKSFIHRLLMSFNGFLIWNWYFHKIGPNLHMILIPQYDDYLITSLKEIISRYPAGNDTVIISDDDRSIECLKNAIVRRVKCKKRVVDYLSAYYMYNPNARISIVSLEYPIGRDGNKLIGLKGLSCNQLVETMINEIG